MHESLYDPCNPGTPRLEGFFEIDIVPVTVNNHCQNILCCEKDHHLGFDKFKSHHKIKSDYEFMHLLDGALLSSQYDEFPFLANKNGIS